MMNTPNFMPSEYLITLGHISKDGMNECFTFKIVSLYFIDTLEKIERMIKEMELTNFNSLTINKVERA